MKRNEIMEMARQTVPPAWLDGRYEYLEAFAKLVAAKEREACAKLIEVSDDVADWEIICGSDGRVLLNAMAEAIRARGEA